MKKFIRPLGIALLIFGIICIFIYAAKEGRKANATYSEMLKNVEDNYSYTSSVVSENLEKSLNIKFLKKDTMGDYFTLTFKITNNSSDHSFTYVKVKVSLLDQNSNVLTSEWTYAVDSTALEAGDSQEFDIMIKKPSSGIAKSYQWEVVDYN